MASIALAARAYQQSFDARPYTTLALTNGALSAVGDAVAQGAQILVRDAHEDARRYDPQRTLRFFTFGFAMGPLIGRWNKFLEHRFPLRALAPTTVGPGAFSPLAAGRVAADQLLAAPLGLAAFLGAMGAMEGRGARHIRRKFADLFPDALRANWQVWPLAQVVNFRYMPLAYRVPFQSSAGIFWNLYLSLLNARGNSRERDEDSMRDTVG
ncbi:hypothetical protein DFH11DRAFT_1500048 [Phellopilus nigrolimitatus]|nr:hypothetical protein DFH11DRAFT_1500048 [Phellopilus nigrolimitatus]